MRKFASGARFAHFPAQMRTFSRLSQRAAPSPFPSTNSVFWTAMRYLVTRDDVRNIAVIAHVDHGKTTLVDTMLKQSGTMADARNRVMDSKDQEKERGITILAKNTAIVLNGDGDEKKRINIVDTPGHLDFGGEVERALQMVEGFILLVDAQEGVKPGTRYVLRKALGLGLKPIIVLNKIDKEDAHLDKTEEAVQDLFLEVAESDDQLDLYFMYGSGRSGYINETPIKSGDLQPLFNAIFDKIPAPSVPKEDSPFQMLVSQLDHDEKTGHRIAIGRIFGGSVKLEDIVAVRVDGQKVNALVKEMKLFVGTEKIQTTSAKFGDIVWVRMQAPIDTELPLKIGATLCDKECGEALPYRAPDEPTFSLVLDQNRSPWANKEIEVASDISILKKRVEKEAMHNTALKWEMDQGKIVLRGRGPLHLSVFLEDMRREGLEMEVRAPSVAMKMIDGQKCEPFEKIQLEVKSQAVSDVVTELAKRHCDTEDIETLANGRSMIHTTMPVRLMMGFPTWFHSKTKGDGVMTHEFAGYLPMVPVDSERKTGGLIALEAGVVTSYGLMHLQTQGRFFVEPGDEVYFGQVVGENTKTPGQDLPVNVCKANENSGGFRANAMEKAKKTTANYSARRLGFEEAIEWVTPDETICLTPKSVRLRFPEFSGKTRMRKPKAATKS